MPPALALASASASASVAVYVERPMPWWAVPTFVVLEAAVVVYFVILIRSKLREDRQQQSIHPAVPWTECAHCFTVQFPQRRRRRQGKTCKTEEPCPVCLEDFKAKQLAVRLPCMCVFHYKCISAWFRTRQCSSTDNNSTHWRCPVDAVPVIKY